MNIERIILWICFFFTIALVTMGVLLIFRTDRSKEHAAFKYLQYFLILTYTYGFYSYWGSILLKFLPFEQNLDQFIQVIQLMGIPFLFAGIATQYLWIRESLSNKLKVGWYLVMLTLILLVGYFTYMFLFENNLIEKLSYRVIAGLIILINGVLLVTKSSLLFTSKNKMNIALLVALSAIGHIVFSYFNESLLYLADTFSFFLINSVIAAMFMYWANPPLIRVESEVLFENFFKKYDITQRESEIILEIYQGKTNQQIADSLFISLQTVKDHTHRIYRKTFVKNRAQLSSKLRELTT